MRSFEGLVISLLMLLAAHSVRGEVDWLLEARIGPAHGSSNFVRRFRHILGPDPLVPAFTFSSAASVINGGDGGAVAGGCLGWSFDLNSPKLVSTLGFVDVSTCLFAKRAFIDLGDGVRRPHGVGLFQGDKLAAQCTVGGAVSRSALRSTTDSQGVVYATCDLATPVVVSGSGWAVCAIYTDLDAAITTCGPADPDPLYIALGSAPQFDLKIVGGASSPVQSLSTAPKMDASTPIYVGPMVFMSPAPSPSPVPVSGPWAAATVLPTTLPLPMMFPPGCYGFSLVASAPITVSLLGVYDFTCGPLALPPDGLALSHEVGLFDASKNLLGSCVVSPGAPPITSGPSTVLTCKPSAPISLAAFTEYRVCATFPMTGCPDNMAAMSVDVITHPLIKLSGASVVNGGTVAFPGSNPMQMFFGPMIYFDAGVPSVPSPSSAPILGASVPVATIPFSTVGTKLLPDAGCYGFSLVPQTSITVVTLGMFDFPNGGFCGERRADALRSLRDLPGDGLVAPHTVMVFDSSQKAIGLCGVYPGAPTVVDNGYTIATCQLPMPIVLAPGSEYRVCASFAAPAPCTPADTLATVGGGLVLNTPLTQPIFGVAGPPGSYPADAPDTYLGPMLFFAAPSASISPAPSKPAPSIPAPSMPAPSMPAPSMAPLPSMPAMSAAASSLAPTASGTPVPSGTPVAVSSCKVTVDGNVFDLTTMDQGVDYTLYFTPPATRDAEELRGFEALRGFEERTSGVPIFFAPPCRALLDASRTAACSSTSMSKRAMDVSTSIVLQGAGACIKVADINTVYAKSPSEGTGLTLMYGAGDTFYCGRPRAAHYNLICDNTVPVTNPPDSTLVVDIPNCMGTITWRHPAACPIASSSSLSSTATRSPSVTPSKSPTKNVITLLFKLVSGSTAPVDALATAANIPRAHIEVVSSHLVGRSAGEAAVLQREADVRASCFDTNLITLSVSLIFETDAEAATLAKLIANADAAVRSSEVCLVNLRSTSNAVSADAPSDASTAASTAAMTAISTPSPPATSLGLTIFLAVGIPLILLVALLAICLYLRRKRKVKAESDIPEDDARLAGWNNELSMLSTSTGSGTSGCSSSFATSTATSTKQSSTAASTTTASSTKASSTTSSGSTTADGPPPPPPPHHAHAHHHHHHPHHHHHHAGHGHVAHHTVHHGVSHHGVSHHGVSHHDVSHHGVSHVVHHTTAGHVTDAGLSHAGVAAESTVVDATGVSP